MIISGTALSLECIGTVIGNDPATILDGRTTSKPASVGLTTSTLEPSTGARWLALPVIGGPPNQFFLKCLGDIDGPRFLDGRTQDGTVGLAPTTKEPFTGTRWNVIDAGFDEVFLQCAGSSTGGKDVRFLNGLLGSGSVNLVERSTGGIIGLHPNTRWRVVDGQPLPNGGGSDTPPFFGATSATSDSSPSLLFTALGVGGPLSS
jgi:hypothetical protein